MINEEERQWRNCVIADLKNLQMKIYGQAFLLALLAFFMIIGFTIITLTGK